tara:strand:+ start:1336 stop:2817 length:1482 start_codon:yes stop_codon:yes gene_type:complete
MALAIPIISSFDKKGISGAIQSFKQLETSSDKAQFALKKAALPATLALAALGATAAKMLSAGEAVNSANARVLQINTTMGLFGAETASVTGRLITLAEKQALLTGVTNIQIKEQQAQLLTFKNLAKTAGEVGGSFDRASQAVLDMQAANLGGSNAAIALGKALENPIKGITALAKSGVTFTEQEKEKIKTLVESNRMLEAQDLVLKAVEKQVSGTAAATADGTARMKEGFAQFSQSLGLALLPILDAVTPVLLAMASWAKDNPGIFLAIASAIGVMAAAIVTYAAATKIAVIANALLATSFTALQVASGLIVFTAIIAGLVLLYARFSWFREGVKGLVNGISDYFEFMGNAWVKASNIIIRGINLLSPFKDIQYIDTISIGHMGEGTSGRSIGHGGMGSGVNNFVAPFTALTPATPTPGKSSGKVTDTPTIFDNTSGNPGGFENAGIGGIQGLTINLDAGLISSPATIGQDIIDAILAAQRNSGVVFAPAVTL